MRRADGAACIAGAVLTLCACVGDDPDPHARPVDAERLVRAGVGVRASGCSLVDQLGSGITVGDSVTVVTAAHTVAGAREISVETFDGRRIATSLLAFDPERDLAVLRATEPIGPGAGVGLGLADVSLGDASVVVWDRDAGVSAAEVEVSRRLAITIEDIYVEERVRRSGLELVGEIVVGDSGAGVVDRDGNVIGIVYAASRDRDLVGFAVDRNEIDAVLAAAESNEADGAEVDPGRCI